MHTSFTDDLDMNGPLLRGDQDTAAGKRSFINMCIINLCCVTKNLCTKINCVCESFINLRCVVLSFMKRVILKNMAAEHSGLVEQTSTIIKYLEDGMGCLDTRHSKLYDKYHLHHSTHIIEDFLEDRLFELPPKDTKFILIPQSNLSCKILIDHGWTNFLQYDVTENEWKLLLSKFKQNNENKYIPLFNPCPLLNLHIDTIEKIVSKNHNNDAQLCLNACDIGCGCGRDDIWLCLRESFKWNIDCIDFNHKMLNRLSQFASNANVLNQISITKSKIRGDGKITLYNDINDDSPFLIYDMNEEKQEKDQNDKGYYFKKEYDLILCVRFLERSIIYNLWKKGKMLRKNGCLLIYTFLEGAEKSSYGHPKNPNRLLKRGELSNVFNNKEMFKIIVDEEMKVEGDRPIQCFLVQRL